MARSRRATAFVVALVSLASAGGSVLVDSPAASAARSASPAAVSGGGASFPQLELEQWRADVARPPYSLKVDYQAAGSTFGREKYISGQLDYGVSDIPFQDDEIARVGASPRRNFVYVPVSAGGLGFMYNVTGTDGRRITNLKLSQRNVCRVFTEESITWNDPAIQAENPGVPLPAEAVRPVVRSDGSGTSFVLSEYCISTAPDIWGKFVSLVLTRSPDSASVQFRNGEPTSQWPNGYGSASTAYASDGVANTVANDVSGKSTITFVEAGFAKERGFPNAIVRNAAGVYHSPDSPNVTAALAYATGRSDGTFGLNYLATDPNAYFPSSYSYVIAQTSGFDTGKGVTLATFLYYSVTQGQKRAEPLGYARLSDVLVRLAIAQISKIPGAPAPPTDLGGAPPPPRPINVPAATGGAGGGTGAKNATGGAKNSGAAKSGAAGGAKNSSGAKSGTSGAATGTGTDTSGASTGLPVAPGSPSGAPDAAVEGTTVTRDPNGKVKIDVTNLPATEADTRSATRAASTISNKDALMTLFEGMLLFGAGSMATGAVATRIRRNDVEVAP